MRHRVQKAVFLAARIRQTVLIKACVPQVCKSRACVVPDDQIQKISSPINVCITLYMCTLFAIAVLAAVLAVASLFCSVRALLAIVSRSLVVLLSRGSNIGISVRCSGAETERRGRGTDGWYLPSMHEVQHICPP
jgi:hypothetical protein